MPIYDYTCSACGSDFEYLARSLKDKAETCPTCGAARPRKNLSVFAAKSAVSPSPAAVCGGCPGKESCFNGGGCGCR